MNITLNVTFNDEQIEKIVGLLSALSGAASVTQPTVVVSEPASGIGSDIEDDEDYPQLADLFKDAPQTEVPAGMGKVNASALNTQTQVTGVDVDASGLPWDGRIHASTKKKTAKGMWKAKRNVDPALTKQVESELAQVMAISTDSETVFPAPDLGEYDPVTVFGGGASPVQFPADQGVSSMPQQTNAAPVPQPTPAATLPAGMPIPTPVPTPAVTAINFPMLLTKLSTRITNQAIGAAFNAKVGELLQSKGIANIPLLASRPDLIPEIDATLEQIWQGLGGQ